MNIAIRFSHLFLTDNIRQKGQFSRYFQAPVLLPSVKLIRRAFRKTAMARGAGQSEKCQGLWDSI